MEKKKNPGGRPRKFESPEQLEEMCMGYINACKENKEPVLVTGMAIACGTNRETINEYGRGTYDTDTDSYSATLKKIKAYCEHDAALRLYSHHVTGSIFNLKNNFGWADKQEIDQNIKGVLNVNLSSVSDEDLEAEIAKLK